MQVGAIGLGEQRITGELRCRCCGRYKLHKHKTRTAVDVEKPRVQRRKPRGFLGIYILVIIYTQARPPRRSVSVISKIRDPTAWDERAVPIRFLFVL